jgi:DNA primase
LLDRAASGVDLNRQDNRKRFLEQMLGVAATIPDAADRDRFADRLAHRAGITESVVRDEIRRAAAGKKTVAPAVAVPSTVRVRPAEQGLLWALVHRPVEGVVAIGQMEPDMLEGLLAAPIFRLAASLAEMPPDMLPELLRERLSEGERAILEQAAATEAAIAAPADCVSALRRMQVERAAARVQDEIDRLQREGGDDGALMEAWGRKKELLQRLEKLA